MDFSGMGFIKLKIKRENHESRHTPDKPGAEVVLVPTGLSCLRNLLELDNDNKQWGKPKEIKSISWLSILRNDNYGDPY